MIKQLFLWILLLINIASFSKQRRPIPENRFSFSSGIGLSYSIWNGVYEKDEHIESNEFHGMTTFSKKNPVGFVLFGEFSCMFRRNFYLSAGFDYNQFNRNFGKYSKYTNPYYNNDVSFIYSGKLIDRNTSFQITINKKFIIKKNSISIGTGILFAFLNEPIITLGFQPYPNPSFSIAGGVQYITEFGFPFQLSYEYAINNRWNIGLKTQFQYLLSTRNPQNIYFSPYIRLNIKRIEKKKQKIVDK